MTETKTCTKCGVCKPLDEFRKDARAKNGRATSCKTCHNAVCKKWLDANKEKSKLAIADWNRRNPEKLKEYRRNRYVKHRERDLQASKRWRTANPEKVKERSRRDSAKRRKKPPLVKDETYFQIKREKNNARVKAWYVANKDRKKEYDIARTQQEKDSLSDGYIKSLLRQGTGLPGNSIPLPLIEAKRQQMKIKRLINERKSQ